VKGEGGEAANEAETSKGDAEDGVSSTESKPQALDGPGERGGG